MAVTDPISDFMTRIRNAAKAKHKRLDIPASKTKKALAQILLDNRFITDYRILEDNKQGILRVHLKYYNQESVIKGMRRVSKPGIRQYRRASELPRVLNGLGIAIISTSKGIITDTQARQLNIGGEVIAYIW